MHIRPFESEPAYTIPGISTQAIAGRAQGMKNIEVWRSTMDPGSQTPLHYHDCEEVVMILSGSGILEVEGKQQPFKAGCTLLVPPKVVHQIINSGSEPIQMFVGLSETPGRTYTPDGQHIPLPWQ